MRIFPRQVRVLALLVLIALSAILGACRLPTQDFGRPLFQLQGDVRHNARINSFLNLTRSEGPAVRFEITNIEALANDNWFPLINGPLILDSEIIGDDQIFLGGEQVPPGSYQRMRITVAKGETKEPGEDYRNLVSEPFMVEIDFEGKLELEIEDSVCLLFFWDVEESIRSEQGLRPVISVSPSLPQLLEGLVYVSCPDIDTVFVIRADKNWVIDSFGIDGGPSYLALDPESSQQRLFALSWRDRSIKAVNLSSNRISHLFPVPLNDVPTFMAINPDGRGSFFLDLLDERSGYLSRMDMNTGRSIVRSYLGFRPEFVTYLQNQGMLAASLSLSQKVVLLDPENFQERGTIATGSSPQGLLEFGNQLYIAEFGDSSVSIVDLPTKSTQGRLSVGFGPRRLQEANNQIYISNYKEGSLSVLIPGQMVVNQEIYGLDRPHEMTFNQFYRRLYVADHGKQALAVIDINTNRLIDHVELGAKPFGLAVIQ